MTPTTPTAVQLATFRHDLTRIEFALETARAARQRSFATEAHDAEERARSTLVQLIDVIDVWIDDYGRAAVDEAVEVAVAAHEDQAADVHVVLLRHEDIAGPMDSRDYIGAPEADAATSGPVKDETLTPPEPPPAPTVALPPEPDPAPSAPGQVADGKWGIYEGQVKVLRGNTFIRCPEFICSMKVPLEADDEEADVERALRSHRTVCAATRPAPRSTPKKKAGRQ